MNLKRPPYFLFAIFLLSTAIVGAQTTISGTVTDAETGEPLPGVNIQVRGTFTGTATSAGGEFELRTDKAPPFRLFFSFIGYETQTLEVESSNSGMEVSMNPQPLNTNEVVVTAQLRDQIVQQTPMSVAVINRQFIARANEIDDAGDLIDYVPGFSGKNYSSNGSWYTIRGINTNAFAIGYDASVAVFHDYVYNGRTPTAGRPFFDVERAEVLKGPQGSLFGRNAVAGVISIHSNKPVFTKEFSADLMVGNWGQRFVKPVLNLPLGNKFAIRYAGVWEQRDGLRTVTNFDDHQNGKKDILANRISLLYRPSSTLNFLLRVENVQTEGGNWPLKSTNPEFGATPDPFGREITLNIAPEDENEYYTASLQANWVLGEQVSLSSITGLNTNLQDPFILDVDGSPTPVALFVNPNNFTNFSQELRLNGKSDRLDWLVAASYFKENVNMIIENQINDFFAIPIILGPFGVPADFCQVNPGCLLEASEISRHEANNISWGIYGNLIYNLSDRLQTTLGLRYSIDDKKLFTRSSLGEGAFHELAGFNIQGPVDTVSSQDTWNALQPQVSLQYDLSNDAMIYGSYSRGFKAGGHNNYTGNTFEPEINNAFEVGLKSNLANERVKLNIAAYYMSFRNLQVQFMENNIIEINNAGKTVSPGVEIESALQIGSGLTFIGNAAFNFAEYKDFVVPNPNSPTGTDDFSGNVPNRNPRTQLSLTGEYVRPINKLGRLVVRADYSYQSKEYHTRGNVDERAFEGYGLLNGLVGIEGLFEGKIDLFAFGTNITDTDYIVHTLGFPEGVNISNVIGVPRLYGLRLKVNNVFDW